MNIKDNYVYEHPYLTLANLYVLQRETSSADGDITCTLPSWNKQSMPCIINKVVILWQSLPEVVDISIRFDVGLFNVSWKLDQLLVILPRKWL